MSVCFWLVDAVGSNALEERHLQALTRLYSHLKPDPRKKPWPSPAYRQNPPQHQWPTSEGIIHDYKIWWGKYIYIVANSPAMGFADRWRPVVAYDVKPVQASLVLMQLGRAICNRGHRGPRPKHTGPRPKTHWGSAAITSCPPLTFLDIGSLLHCSVFCTVTRVAPFLCRGTRFACLATALQLADSRLAQEWLRYALRDYVAMWCVWSE